MNVAEVRSMLVDRSNHKTWNFPYQITDHSCNFYLDTIKWVEMHNKNIPFSYITGKFNSSIKRWIEFQTVNILRHCNTNGTVIVCTRDNNILSHESGFGYGPNSHAFICFIVFTTIPILLDRKDLEWLPDRIEDSEENLCRIKVEEKIEEVHSL